MKKFLYNIITFSIIIIFFYSVIKLQEQYADKLVYTQTNSSAGAEFAGKWSKLRNYDLGGETKEHQFTLSDKTKNSSKNEIIINGEIINDLIKNKLQCQWINNHDKIIKTEIYLFNKTKNAVVLKMNTLKNSLDNNNNNIYQIFAHNSYDLTWSEDFFLINNKDKNKKIIDFESLRIHRRKYNIDIKYNNIYKLSRGICKK